MARTKAKMIPKTDLMNFQALPMATLLGRSACTSEPPTLVSVPTSSLSQAKPMM
jgi:hypothetical protein